MSDLAHVPISTVSVSDSFFDTLRTDYPGFDDWLGRKSGAAKARVEVDAAAARHGYVTWRTCDVLDDGRLPREPEPLDVYRPPSLSCVRYLSPWSLD